jgi:H+/Cl- antiporter ClcA
MTRQPDWKAIKRKIQFQVQYSTLYVTWFLRWLVFGAITGVICGLVGVAFHVCINLVTETRLANDWLLWFLPVSGLFIVGMYHIMGLDHDPGTNLVLSSIQAKGHIPVQLAPLIFIGSVITHLFGGSSGREGAALQIGGSLGEALGRLFGLKDTDINIIVICGMSAVFAALFGTPIAAVVFSMEVITIGVIHYSAFVPSIVSAAVAYGIAQKLQVTDALYPALASPELSVFIFLKVIVLAIVCGLVSILFCVAMHQSMHLYRKYIPNDYIRIFTGGCIVVALTLLMDTRMYNGHGADIIMLAVTGGDCPTFAFLLKILFTALTLGAGFKGGEIVPTFCIGATFGCAFGGLLGLDPGICAALALVGLFCCATNSPWASIVLSVEMFGASNLHLFALVCVICFVLSGKTGLYASQIIQFSKATQVGKE